MKNNYNVLNQFNFDFKEVQRKLNNNKLRDNINIIQENEINDNDKFSENEIEELNNIDIIQESEMDNNDEFLEDNISIIQEKEFDDEFLEDNEIKKSDDNQFLKGKY